MASQTSYGYAGAKVTVTDAAAKSKIFTTDAVGNLTQVQETDPNLGTVYTNYTYDVLNQLRTVSMPRGSYTQTRTFTYAAWGPTNGVNSINGVGPFLTSATNPENGTVTTSYGGTLPSYKIDAKGQKIAYTYDSYARVTQIAKYPDGVNEDVCQRVTYNYDTNPDDGTYTQYPSGRLTSLHYAGASCQTPGSQPNGGSAVSGNNYIEMFSYTQAGQVAKKKFRLTKTTLTYPSTQTVAAGDLEAVYTYDQEGKMLSQNYPLGTTYQYAYDNLGRPTKMTDTQLSQDLVSTASYGPAGELLSMTGTSVGETRTYNANGQLTQLTGLNGVNLKYNYAAAGSNNGQIVSQQDLVSGETITYHYDSLKRLASASSTQGWAQGFAYDGFGNLIAKSALSGNPPVGNYPADATTNRLTNASYDANGNQTSAGNYDVSNRMISTPLGSTLAYFEYDPSNKRVYQQRQHYNGNNYVTDSTEYYFYSIGGKRIGTYSASFNGASIMWGLQGTQVFFKGKLLSGSSGAVQQDYRGSVGSYYPYGEDRNLTANDSVKFATYTRDSASGLDYASNRYYDSGAARFSSSDPYSASGGPRQPGSWNRFSYAGGDPVTFFDPNGLDTRKPQFLCAWVMGQLESCDLIYLESDVTGGGGGDPRGTRDGGGGGGNANNVKPQDLAYPIAKTLQKLANAAKDAITNCEAIAQFAASMAQAFSSAAKFVESFGVLTPNIPFMTTVGVANNTNAIWIGGTSGFSTQYQDGYGSDAGPNEDDQAHHFAFFFQVGFLGMDELGLAPAALELVEGTPSNQGDINLGLVAEQLGTALKLGTIDPRQVADLIRDKLCVK